MQLNFVEFKRAIQSQFSRMVQHGPLFVTGTDKYKLWETYLASFPEGTNPVFRARTEHDCQCCKQFLRTCGSLVAIVGNRPMSIWDIQIGGPYQAVADAMSAFVKSKLIETVFYHHEQVVGTNFNHQQTTEGVLRWEHFFLTLPANVVLPETKAGSVRAEVLSTYDVFKRSMQEISIDAAETVLDLIDQGSLYRGEEHRGLVQLFLNHRRKLDTLVCAREVDDYFWVQAVVLGPAARIRNTVIGSLLTDLSEGKELDSAVKSFEAKVAPTNYKRPTAVVSKAMVQKVRLKAVVASLYNFLNGPWYLTTAQGVMTMKLSKDEKKARIDKLKKLLRPNDNIYTALNHVSRSGMSRSISLLIGRGREVIDITWLCAGLLGDMDRKHGGIKIGGCGMDMGFELVYRLGCQLWPKGTRKPHGTRNGEPDAHGGYALKHRWI